MEKTFIITEKEFAEFEHLKNTYANCEICNRDFTKTVEMLKRQNNDLRKRNADLKANANKVVIEKLEGLYKWTCQNHFTEEELDNKIYQLIAE